MSVHTTARLSVLSSRLLEVGSTLGSTQHELVALAARFEASNEWILDGAPSAAHWIAEQLDVCVATAENETELVIWPPACPRVDSATRSLPGHNAMRTTAIAMPATNASDP